MKLLNRIVQGMPAAGLELYYPFGDGESFWRKARNGAAYSADRAELHAEAKRLLDAPASPLTYSLFAEFHGSGQRLNYERVYFEKRRRLNTFALLALLEPEAEHYRQALLEAVWDICSELTWCLPAHVGEDESLNAAIDLFSAETGFAMAELRMLLGERIPPLLRTMMAEQVERRLFTPFLEKGPYYWEEAEHNWSAVCAGSIGSAALLLLNEGEELERLEAILQRTQHIMSFYLRGFGEDGACLEGLDYWNYGFGYFVYYADLLSGRSGGALDWFSDKKVRDIARFPQTCWLGGNAVVNFSDALPYTNVHIGLSSYLAGKVPGVEKPQLDRRADFRADPCSRWAAALRNLLWRDCADSDATQAILGDVVLENAGWLVSRSLSEHGLFGFAAKGGHNDEPHNHNDLGHFMVTGEGVFYLCDLGCGEYTKDYFGEGRYDYACNGSQGHSVPIINGQYQLPGLAHDATVLEATCTATVSSMTVELSKAYGAHGLQSLMRSWSWHKSPWPKLTLRDVYRFTEVPERLTERFVTWLRPEQAGEPGVLHLISDDAPGIGLEVHFDPQRLEFEMTEQVYRNHDGVDTAWYALDFHVVQPQLALELEFEFKFVAGLAAT
ncbi:hypothetical protein [Paenibacillus senegalimassiliensis]|uniref:hypothetical protein n=1 Tax=Paenibacillus senegalimassiliensis TaxID=1737426 RepID=UPI00073F993D|nr:hypothetical protein [Paenibacillus senegalimassiliensis]